jgi:hypothetical protein
MNLSDRLNEYRLRIAGARFIAARKCGDRDGEVSAWVRLRWLHTQRSVERVMAMEFEEGLR